jgi:heme exporter protein CcmD
MNDHATFIWLSYGLGALILAWTALSPLLKKRKVLQQIKLMHRREMQNDSNS